MEREKILSLLDGFKKFIWKALIVVVVSGGISFIYAKDLIHFLLKVVNIKVYYLSLQEAFFASVELALYAGIFFALPLIIYLVWHEFRGTLGFKTFQGYIYIFSTVFLFYLGGIYCCYVVLPSGIEFLLSYGSENIKAMISIERFVVFCTAMVFAFGITFEVPIILMILGRIGILKSRMLTKTRRFAILFIAIAAALITPTPDVYNMMLLAVPMYILYEIGILLMKIGEKKRASN